MAARTSRHGQAERLRAMCESAGIPPGFLVIDRVPVGRFVDAAPPVRHEADVTILPVTEEIVVTERRLILKEEIHFGPVQSIAP